MLDLEGRQRETSNGFIPLEAEYDGSALSEPSTGVGLLSSPGTHIHILNHQNFP